MPSQNPKFKQVDKRLMGESVVVGEHIIQPVAQVKGWHLTARGETAKGTGALLRVIPIEVIVGKGDNEPYPVPITNESQEAMKGIAIAGLLVAIICWFVIIGVNVIKFYKEKKK
jgi:hypothetical protein